MKCFVEFIKVIFLSIDFLSFKNVYNVYIWIENLDLWVLLWMFLMFNSFLKFFVFDYFWIYMYDIIFVIYFLRGLVGYCYF